MTEEAVTKALLVWLTARGWEILCYDFPQSGTGYLLHPDGVAGEKNRGGVIPDIVAVKGEHAAFFENKNRFVLEDFEKQHRMIAENPCAASVDRLLAGQGIRRVWYGIGLPRPAWGARAEHAAALVDFVLAVGPNGGVAAVHNPAKIPF